MRIGFDAKRAAQNATGLGNYSRFVMRILHEAAPQHEYTAYVPSPKKMQHLSRHFDWLTLRYPLSGFWKHLRSLWRIWGMTKDIAQDRIALFHGLSNELPLNIRNARDTRSIVTIHDLIFLRLPECYPLIDRQIYNYKFRRACIHSDRIIAVSECTKRDIVQFYGISPEKIDVVYQGCDSAFSQPIAEEKKEEIRRKYRLPDKYILYVGSIEKRKNLLLLAQALEFLDDDYQVVAVGKHTPYADEVTNFVRQKGLSHRLHMIHGVPFADLPTLYRLATTFVYPSFYEGFGIPLLEALRSGVPVVGATGSCLEEAGGAHSLYVSPTDAKGLAAAIHRTYTDEHLRRTMIEQGHAHALRFEETRLAQDLLHVYDKVMTEKR